MELDEFRQIEESQETEQQVINGYKTIFTGVIGQLILEDMLFDLYFLQPCETPEQQALCNYAKALLVKIYGQPIESNILRNWFKKLLKRKTK